MINHRREIAEANDESLIRQECATDLFGEINQLAISLAEIVPIKYNWSGAQFSSVWRRKRSVFNGSDPVTLQRFMYAIMYQVVANYNDVIYPLLNDSNQIDVLKCIIYSYYLLLSTAIDNNNVYKYIDDANQVRYRYAPFYVEIMIEVCDKIISLLGQQDLNIEDLDGNQRALRL